MYSAAYIPGKQIMASPTANGVTHDNIIIHFKSVFSVLLTHNRQVLMYNIYMYNYVSIHQDSSHRTYSPPFLFYLV